MDNHRRETRAQFARLAPSATAGEATFSGCIAKIDVARDILTSKLPPSVVLPQKDSSTYPCLLVFGEQLDGTTFFGGLPVRWGIRYHELMVAIPFVLWAGDPGEHLFVLGMTCDFWPAVWNGNYYYGFHKRLAQMGWSGQGFSVAGENHRPGFHAVLRPAGKVAGRKLDQIRAAAALSVLGQRNDGVFVRSRFDWDLRETATEAASLSLTLGPHFRELPAASSARQDDTYWIREMRWRLSWPG
jgi:hypothetical protein